jgi:hypothetical protein
MLLLFPTATFVLLLVLYRRLGRMLPGVYAARFFLLYYLMQAGLVAVLLLVDADTRLWNYTYDLSLADAVPRLCGCFLLEGAAAGVVYVLLRGPLGRVSRGAPSLVTRIRDADGPTNAYLALLAVLLMLNLFANADGLVFYFIRISLDLTFVAAFVAGVRVRRTGLGLQLLWWLALAGAAVRAVLGGGRTDFLPLLLYGWGVFLQLTSWKARAALLLVALALTPSFVVLNGFIGSYRLKNGRVANLHELTTDRLETALRARDQVAVGHRTPLQMVLERLLNHPNAAVVVLSPEEIPFRGWANLPDEVADAFDITGLRGREAIAAVREAWREQEFGLGAANGYGFYAGLKSGVEFSILADGYSRAGYAGVLLYGLLAVLVLLGVEYTLLRLCPAVSADGVFVLVFLLYIALGVFYAYPAFWTLKFLVLRTLDYGLVTRGFGLVWGTFTATEPGTVRRL